MTDKCWCGRPLHYRNQINKQLVDDIIEQYGEYVNVIVNGGKTYKVPRHYIGLHGIASKDLAALGFEEVKT